MAAGLAVEALDHLVLTVADIDATCAFYEWVLGMTAVTFAGQKINLHQAGAEFEPKAARPTPGSADLCLLVSGPIDAVVDHLAAENVPVEEGPIARTGARGPITSVYLRDPDGNLIEIATYD